MVNLPREGTRLSLLGHLGTVRFVGPVDNTTGIWIGVEWDDPQRGKHDGVKDGKRYFTCRISNAGSFIRPSAPISYGTSFLQALRSKYIEAFHGPQETVVLGSSHGAIEVEAVRLDKIRGKFADLGRLREVSLDNDFVAEADVPGAIRETCPNIRGLDLSTSLISNWGTVAAIAVELPILLRLALNRNRLQPPRDLDKMAAAFLSVTDLQLNGTLTSWREMQQITSFMPRLRLLEMGYNNLTFLSDAGTFTATESTIQDINLDTNSCRDWVHICDSLQPYKSLDRLVLASNSIESIPFPDERHARLNGLKHISITSNLLTTWSDIDALSSWCPRLESLAISDNPLAQDSDTAKYTRQFIVSKLPSLLALDATPISIKERTDCELFYMSYISQNELGSEEARRRSHPQWEQLCLKHGAPDIPVKQDRGPDKLGNRLIELHLFRCFDIPTRNDAQEIDVLINSSESFPLRVLPTMMLRLLRMKICKTVKCNPNHTDVVLWLRMNDGSLSELGMERDNQDLSWLGLEKDTNILFYIRDR